MRTTKISRLDWAREDLKDGTAACPALCSEFMGGCKETVHAAMLPGAKKRKWMKRRSQGGRGVILLKFLAYIVVLCFELRGDVSKQILFLPCKSKYLAPPKTSSWLRYWKGFVDYSDFSRGARSSEILFVPLEKTTFFAKNVILKCKIPKSRGKALPPPLPASI